MYIYMTPKMFYILLYTCI